jgi:hypothetical protein
MKDDDRALSRKNNMLFPVLAMIISLSFLLPSSFILAQEQDVPEDTQYSDGELETFVETAFEIMPLQEESQLKMIGEIEDRRLTVERFSVILEVQQLGLDDPGIGEDEMEAFEETMKAIQEIQLEYQVLIVEAIEEKGMTVAKYEEILSRYQQDPELQERIDKIMEDMGYE